VNNACHRICLINCSILTIARLLDIDDFIENLWKIHEQVKSEGYVQVCSFDIVYWPAII
jgi:hypothetical protein